MSEIEQSRTPTLSELLEASMSQVFDGMFVAMPGIVVKYYDDKQLADIRPALKKPFLSSDGTESSDELAMLPKVPVLYPRGGGFFMHFPLKKNDNVLLIFCDNSITEFMLGSGTSQLDPIDLRTHDISDAVAIPNFFTFLKALKDANNKDMILGKDKGGMQLRITEEDKAEFNLQGDSSKHVPIVEALESFWTRVENKLNTWGGVAGHAHNTSTGLSGPPTPVLNVDSWDSSINSTKISIPDG